MQITVDFTWSALFLCYFTYAFIGWAYESFIWAPLEKKQFLNRGFLIGPCCPIYGIVAILDYYCLFWIKNGVGIFFFAIFICCLFEYLVSFTFEKIFGERWWDYSNYAFNLNGRISLYSGIIFGILGLFQTKIFHPFVFTSYSKIPLNIRIILVWVLSIIIFSDTIFSVICMKKLNSNLNRLYDSINHITHLPFDLINKNKEEREKKGLAKFFRFSVDKFFIFNDKLIVFQNKIFKKSEDKNINSGN
ncbi:MAG: putative ABC transporter permease [Treponema sp.]|nr:putative ABC transporter permease [Treponema sp.]